MLSGRTPFRAATEHLVFEAINGHADGARPLLFPDSIPAHSSGSGASRGFARELIEGMLRKEPELRLGAGAADAAHGYPALKVRTLSVLANSSSL